MPTMRTCPNGHQGEWPAIPFCPLCGERFAEGLAATPGGPPPAGPDLPAAPPAEGGWDGGAAFVSRAEDSYFGQVMGGYRLIGKLGEGGIGPVYLAGASGTPSFSPVAVKVLSRDRAVEALELLERMRRQVAVAGQLRHPSVQDVLDIIQEEGDHLLVMEYVDGRNLRQCMSGKLRVGVPFFLSLAETLLRALDHVHACGIVHRDVKPDNILVRVAQEPGHFELPELPEEVKLADFGLALLGPAPQPEQEGADSLGTLLGTPEYIAPEQVDAPDRVDGRADIYALGCTLHEVICGRRAYPVDSFLQLLYHHRAVPHPDFRQVFGGSAYAPVFDGLATILRKMMAVRPEERYASCALVLADLQRWAARWEAEVREDHNRPHSGDSPTREFDGRECRAFLRDPAGDAPAGDPSPGAPTPPVQSNTLPWGTSPAQPPPFVEPRVGDVIAGCRLLEQIGKGGMATVYRAWHLRFDLEVVVKVATAAVQGTEQYTERARREAHAIARLDHPHIVKVLHIGSEKEGSCLVMELVEGETVLDRIHRLGALDVGETLGVAEEVLSALEAAHGQGILHRDVKPANILLRAGSPGPVVAKLTDFFLARVRYLPSHTPDGQILGTPAYMAPEITEVGTRGLDARSDLYSFGCTLFEMLSGQLPFRASQYRDVLELHRTAPVPDLAALRPGIPPALAALVGRLMAKAPADRPQSVREVLDAVRALRSPPAEPAGAPWWRRLFGRAVPQPAGSTAQPPAVPPAPAAPPLPAPVPAPVGAAFGEEAAFSSQAVVIHYPAPIALPYRRFCGQPEEQVRLGLLFAAVEAVLRYLVTLGVSDLLACRAASRQGGPALPEGDTFDFLRRPVPMQLGLWVKALRETAQALAGQSGRFIPELPAACEPKTPLYDSLDWLVSRRNKCIHPQGSIAMTRDECQEAVVEARPRLEEVLQRVRFVCAYPLGFARKGPEIQAGPAQQSWYLHSCMGARVDTSREAYLAPAAVALQEDTPFVISPDGSRLLYLWPLLGQRRSEWTGQPTLYAFEEVKDRKHPFLTRIRSAAIDVREEWVQTLRDQPAADHGWLLERLRGLPARLVLPPGLALARHLLPSKGGKLTGLQLGPVRLRAAIGEGGFGTIYAAETDDGQRIAVKVLESPVWHKQQLRFRQEYEKLRQAAHPGIIRCYDWGTALLDGRAYPWYSMEFAVGGDLRGRINSRRSPPALPWDDPALREQVSREFREVADAVAHLHDLNIIHRDIKPGNVLIRENGELCLSDFGLAKGLAPSEKSLLYAAQSSEGAVLGTPVYMAPEQARGEEADKPADVYALGILLAEMAAGRRPAPNLALRQGSTLKDCPAVRSLPGPLRSFLLRCTDASPAERFPDARAVHDAFLQLAG